VARAKRTQRADARRRYRQTAAAEPETDELDESVTTAPAASSSTARRPAPPSSSGRPLGFMEGMRAAWHRPDVRADLAALPSLVTGRWFLIPLALVLVGTAGVMLFPTNYITGLFFQLFVYPPAMAPVFIVGFFARRASYMLGFIISLVSVIGYAAFVYAVLPTLVTDVPATQNSQDLVLSAFVIGPLSGILFAAGAAWYRRFLAFSGAQRMRQRQQRSGQRPGQRPGQQRSKASKPARG